MIIKRFFGLILGIIGLNLLLLGGGCMIMMLNQGLIESFTELLVPFAISCAVLIVGLYIFKCAKKLLWDTPQDDVNNPSEHHEPSPYVNYNDGSQKGSDDKRGG